jgi:hypothetical protein
MRKKFKSRGKTHEERDQRHRHASNNKKSGGKNGTRQATALLYAKAGLPVVPLHGLKNGGCTCDNEDCEQPGRHPRIKHPTANHALIKKYWTKWPKAKIGVVLGAESGVLALVVDGSAGRKTLRALEEKTQ